MPRTIDDIRDALGGLEELYRTLFERAPVGVFLYAKHADSMQLIDFNPRLVEVLGTTSQRLREAGLSVLRDLPLQAALVQGLHGDPVRYEGPLDPRRGPEHGQSVTLRTTPIRDAKGSLVAVLATLEDTTEREAALVARAVSEKRLSRYVEQNPLAIMFLNTKFEVMEWNEAATKTFGFTADEMRGKTPLRIIPEPVRDFVWDVWRKLLSGESQRVTNANVTKDGRTILCEWHNTPLFDDSNRVVGAASIAADVTAQTLESQALKRSEARFRSLAELTPDAISVIRGDRFLYVNPAFARYLRYPSSDDLMAIPVESTISPEDRERAKDHLEQVRRQREVPAIELRMVCKDGDLVTCEVMSMQIDFDGEPATLSTLRDLTDRKRMQARLLQSDRMASVGTLAAGVAHEINNPLAYMKANLDVLLARKLPEVNRRARAIEEELGRSAALRELLGDVAAGLSNTLSEVSSMVAIAQEGTERVRGIVRDLKTFSRADDESSAPCDVPHVLDASINLAWNAIRHRATLTREYDEVPPVQANESRLGQVFLNLLLNAAQAIGPGEVADHEILVRCSKAHDNMVCVSVSDTGIGIAKDALSRVFDPFYTTKPVGIGTGLGLWVCQGIVTTLGGKIDVQSEEGRGTTVSVLLPSRYGAVSTEQSEPRSLRRGRVLVIDPEPVLGSALSIALYAEQDVVASTSGKDAISIIGRHGLFDVVFCEAELPDMTALELYYAIVRKNPSMGPRFVFVTGRSLSPELEAEIAALPNERVARPFDVATLIHVVRAQIERTRPSLAVPRPS